MFRSAKTRLTLVPLAIAVGLVGCGGSDETTGQASLPELGVADPGPVIATEFTFADSFPLKHYLSKEGMVWWMKRTEELTNGQVTFRHFPAGQLAKAEAILQKVRDGAVNAGYVGIGYVSDRMPLNGVSMIAGLTGASLPGSRAYWRLVKDGSLRQEFDANGVVPLFAVVLPAYQILLTRGPIAAVTDFQGLKIRSSGTLNLAVQALGATPIEMPATDLYFAMQRGTLDGSLLAATSVTAYNLQEVIKSISANGAFGSFPITAVMNDKNFNQLSQDQQKALLQAGDETVEHLARHQDESVNKTLADFESLGIEVYALSDALLAALNQRLQDQQTNWVKRMQDRDLDGESALAEFKAAMQADTKH